MEPASAAGTRAASAAAPDDALAYAMRWHAGGDAVALATVTETWGSAPCPVGSMMAVSRQRPDRGIGERRLRRGRRVVQAAQDAIADGAPRRLSFAVSDGSAWSVGLACGGTIKVFVEALQLA